MVVCITPKSQPIDNFVGKAFNAYNIDYCDTYALSAHENDKWYPIMTRYQICTQWVVKVRKKVSENVILKSWMVLGYKSVSKLENVEGSINNVAKHSRA